MSASQKSTKKSTNRDIVINYY